MTERESGTGRERSIADGEGVAPAPRRNRRAVVPVVESILLAAWLIALVASLPHGGPGVVGDGRTVAWEGGLCLDLERWLGTDWEWIGSASYAGAHIGRWGAPRTPEYCDAARVIDGSVTLPADAADGSYRFCSVPGSGNCIGLRTAERPDG